MDFLNETGLEAAWIVSQIKRRTFALVVLVKGTFQLRPGDAAVLSEEQLPLTGDEFEAGDPARPLRYPFDFAPFKPRADVLVVGTCHAPDSARASVVSVSVQVGPLAKSLRVYGDRYWLGEGQTTAPEPFVAMPLTWEAAYGGPGFAANPWGRGRQRIERPDGTIVHPLPNIESPAHPLRTWSDEVEPAGFGPIPDTSPQRVKKFGSFDDGYLRELWPGYPRNFDSGFFNTAPEDQQIDGYLTGDEVFAAENLHPSLSAYRGRLPGLRVRAFLNEQVHVQEELREIPMRLDTLWLDMDAERLVLVWRGHQKVSSERLEEVSHLLVAAEPTSLEQPGTIEDYRLLLDHALARRELEDDELDEEEEQVEEDEEGEAEAEEPSALLAAVAETEEPGLEQPEDQQEQSPDDEEALTESRVKEMIALGRSFAGCDLSDLELHRLDFSGLDLREAILQGTTLAESNLSGADLSGAVLAGANLHESKCTGTNFAGADLTVAWLVRADLTGADLTGADLTKAQLRGAALGGVKAAESVFVEADLSDADLQGANLSGADLCGSRLHRTNLAGANLTDAALENAWGRNLEAPNAILHKVRGAGAVLYAANFRETTGEESVWESADLYAADFTGATLPRAVFSGANLFRAVFDAATIKEARFNEANLRRARMVRCNLYEASLESADLRETNLNEANLFGATLIDAVVQQTNFTGANLRRIKTREDSK